MTQIQKPQRLSPPAAPGELLKRLTNIHTRLKLKATAERDPVYLSLIRQLPCLKCGLEPCGEAAHVRYNANAPNKRQALGKKPPDRFAVPLCQGCHWRDPDSQHKTGEALFWHRVGLNPLLVAQQLYEKRGDLLAMRAVAMTAIAERSSPSIEVVRR